jgi:hypothetical protein
MAHGIAIGSILFKDDTLLPGEIHFAAEPCAIGWAVVDCDGRELDIEIQKAGWTLCCSDAETKATVFGIDHQKMLHRAIAQILDRGVLDYVNSLEITRVKSVGSERFPLIRYVTVWAKWRHFRRPLIPFRAGDVLILRAGLGQGADWNREPLVRTAPMECRPTKVYWNRMILTGPKAFAG